MGLRRGFKAHAERIANDVRSAELDLAYDERFDPRALAELYGVPLHSLADLASAGATKKSIRQLTVVDTGAFSAGTVFRGSTRLVIYNEAHADGRLANSMSHELAHLILEHAPTPALDDSGCRVWDADKEDEANTLAGMLLVTREAALACARIGLPHSIGAARFGVSSDMMRMRTDTSGAAAQARHGAAHAGRTIPRLPTSALGQLPHTHEMAFLGELAAEQWRTFLKACRAPLASKSIDGIIDVLDDFRGS